MRRFVVLGHTQRTAPPIPLDDAAGAGGRWDLLARAVTQALLVSHGTRQDAEIILALAGGPRPRAVRVSGAQVRRLNPDERSTVALLSKALEATDVGEHETSVLQGIHVSGRSLERILAGLAGDVCYLREDATAALESWKPAGGDVTFLLSDHRDPTPDEDALIRSRRPIELTLGPVSLQADQCITVVHNRLDRLANRR